MEVFPDNVLPTGESAVTGRWVRAAGGAVGWAVEELSVTVN